MNLVPQLIPPWELEEGDLLPNGQWIVHIHTSEIGTFVEWNTGKSEHVLRGAWVVARREW